MNLINVYIQNDIKKCSTYPVIRPNSSKTHVHLFQKTSNGFFFPMVKTPENTYTTLAGFDLKLIPPRLTQ